MKKFASILAAGAISSSLTAVTHGDEPGGVSPRSGAVFVVSEVRSQEGTTNEDETEVEVAKEAKDVVVKGNSKSVIVQMQSSSKSDENGGKPTTKVRGKMIFIDPDGKRKEIDLDEQQMKEIRIDADGDSLAEKVMIMKLHDLDIDSIEEMDSEIDEEVATETRYVIGVQCEEADELLRKHLKLDGQGVVVLQVREETPAAEAGFEKDDIIVSVGDRKIASGVDLSAAVMESKGQPLNCAVIRAGDSMVLTVTAKQMQVPVASMEMEVQGMPLSEMMLNGNDRVLMKKILPGIMIEGMPQGQAEIQAMLGNLRKSAIAEAMSNRDETEQAMEEMREEMNALKKQLLELRKDLKELNKQ